MKTKTNKPATKKRTDSPFISRHDSPGFIAVQAKYSIGKPGDQYETEADQVAEKIVHKNSVENSSFFSPENKSVVRQFPENSIQEKPVADGLTPFIQKQPEKEEEPVQLKKVEEEEEEPIQMQEIEEEEEPVQLQPEDEEEDLMPKAEKQVSDPTNDTENRISNSKGSGDSMSPIIQAQMESGFGTDFSQVKIHHGASAADLNKQLGAQAFTSGNDIFFNSGKYNPETTAGKQLLAHELTHTIQQGNGSQTNHAAIQNSGNLIQLTPDEDFLHTSDIQLMQCVSDFDELYRLSSNYSVGSRVIGDLVRQKFLREANTFQTAYNLYSGTIAAARREAQNQNQ